MVPPELLRSGEKEAGRGPERLPDGVTEKVLAELTLHLPHPGTLRVELDPELPAGVLLPECPVEIALALGLRDEEREVHHPSVGRDRSKLVPDVAQLPEF